MNLLTKKVLLINFLLAGTFTGFAQQIESDLQLAATGGTYAGIGYPGELHVTITNNGFNAVPGSAFKINLGLPSTATFNETYPGCPAGWSYTKLGPQDAQLTTATTLPWPVSFTPNYVLYEQQFNVPFTTVLEGTPAPVTVAQLIVLTPATYTDADVTNNSPTSTVVVGGTPLPVQFASFEAKANGCDVNLNWITSNEKENAYFNVERSANGTKFETIDKVASQGNSSNAKRYNFVDANPLTGKSFYRISQVDIDGKSTSTKMEPVTVNCMVSTIEMYPNPATDFINVKGMQTGVNTVRVINVAGQVVAEEVSEVGQQQVNIAKLASGTYQVQVSNNDQVVFTGKFVKAK